MGAIYLVRARRRLGRIDTPEGATPVVRPNRPPTRRRPPLTSATCSRGEQNHEQGTARDMPPPAAPPPQAIPAALLMVASPLECAATPLAPRGESTGAGNRRDHRRGPRCNSTNGR